MYVYMNSHLIKVVEGVSELLRAKRMLGSGCCFLLFPCNVPSHTQTKLLKVNQTVTVYVHLVKVRASEHSLFAGGNWH